MYSRSIVSHVFSLTSTFYAFQFYQMSRGVKAGGNGRRKASASGKGVEDGGQTSDDEVFRDGRQS